jgi:hypothetical protein
MGTGICKQQVFKIILKYQIRFLSAGLRKRDRFSPFVLRPAEKKNQKIIG